MKDDEKNLEKLAAFLYSKSNLNDRKVHQYACLVLIEKLMKGYITMEDNESIDGYLNSIYVYDNFNEALKDVMSVDAKIEGRYKRMMKEYKKRPTWDAWMDIFDDSDRVSLLYATHPAYYKQGSNYKPIAILIP